MSTRFDRDTWYFALLMTIVARKSDFLSSMLAAVERGIEIPDSGNHSHEQVEARLGAIIGSLSPKLFLSAEEQRVRNRIYPSTKLEDLDREAIWEAIRAALRERS